MTSVAGKTPAVELEMGNRTVRISNPDRVYFPRDQGDDVLPEDCSIATVPDRFAKLGDVHEGIDDAVFSLEPLLERAARDEREGEPAPPPAEE